tara:strand:- start:1750 stop:1929 length:180 start_codon:yes stop_codon:yes gene_type:complete
MGDWASSLKAVLTASLEASLKASLKASPKAVLERLQGIAFKPLLLRGRSPGRDVLGAIG